MGEAQPMLRTAIRHPKSFQGQAVKMAKVTSQGRQRVRTFSDFLNACLQAIPHVTGLEILSEENQKLIHKLPDWLASRWNRQVTITLMQGGEFPTFEDFTNFVSTEAEIACNPVTSLHALHSSSSSYDKKNFKETKGSKFNVFSTQTVTNNDKSTLSNVKSRPTCMWCKNDKHQLPKCSGFMEKSLDERRMYVRDNKLCYGCVKPGHSAKECHHRLTCDVCKGRHPTCLHDENYKRHEGRERHVSTLNTAPNTMSENTAATALSVTGGGQPGSTSMIVPVWVSSAEYPSNEQLVYALLHTQSGSTFIDKDISNKLQTNTYPVKLKLTTVLGENMIMKSERVARLFL